MQVVQTHLEDEARHRHKREENRHQANGEARKDARSRLQREIGKTKRSPKVPRVF